LTFEFRKFYDRTEVFRFRLEYSEGDYSEGGYSERDYSEPAYSEPAYIEPAYSESPFILNTMSCTKHSINSWLSCDIVNSAYSSRTHLLAINGLELQL